MAAVVPVAPPVAPVDVGPMIDPVDLLRPHMGMFLRAGLKGVGSVDTRKTLLDNVHYHEQQEHEKC